MKKIIIVLIISAITLLMSSCGGGCGCPGGAGYPKRPTTQTFNQHTIENQALLNITYS